MLRAIKRWWRGEANREAWRRLPIEDKRYIAEQMLACAEGMPSNAVYVGDGLYHVTMQDGGVLPVRDMS